LKLELVDGIELDGEFCGDFSLGECSWERRQCVENSCSVAGKVCLGNWLGIIQSLAWRMAGNDLKFVAILLEQLSIPRRLGWGSSIT